MINKTRIQLIITNTLVLMVLLIAVSSIMYTITSVSIKNSVDLELINMAYESKRFCEYNYIEENLPAKERQNFEFFEEKLMNQDMSISVYNKNFELMYQQGVLEVSPDILKEIALSYFNEDVPSTKVYTQTDGIYNVNYYKHEDISLRTATTVIAKSNGNLQIIFLSKNIITQNNILQDVMYSIAITAIIGLLLSLVASYYIANRSLIPIKSTIDNQKQFIADASHELRTPLAIIKTNLELVLSNEEESVASQEMWLNNAYSEIGRMDKLVGDLLILSKADLNEIPFEFKKADIVFAIKDTLEKLQPIASSKNLQLACVSSLSQMKINVDLDKFIQLIIILVDNAIKYSYESKDILVYIDSYHSKTTNKKYLQVKVSNQGDILSKEQIDKVFKRFYRIDKARSNRNNGSGLGLSIAKWIVRGHSGTISIESTKEKGTIITVSIPYASIKEE